MRQTLITWGLFLVALPFILWAAAKAKVTGKPYQSPFDIV
jgi:hypothetical protein